jgi:inosine-uridine nucleoside N-ribohydrolase
VYPYSFRVDSFHAEERKRQIAEQREQQANPPRPNLVDDIKEWAHSNPVTAYAIIAVGAITFVATALNQSASFLKTIWFWGKP